ncbi:hypothetical protein GYB22_11550 [bacterium]|nr:hypothetical protein [bacterium]
MQQQIPLYRTTKGFQHNHKVTALKCENCDQEFLANRKTAKFCSSSCRSQFWLSKNKKKVITIAVPADIDDAYLEKIKNMLVNYKSNVSATLEHSNPHTFHEEVFDTEQDLRSFMSQAGFTDYKVPKIDHGIYYDEGLTIRKTEEGWMVKIAS